MNASRSRTAAERLRDALRRVEALDRRGPLLNALPRLDPDLLREVDRPGPLAGRVYTVKDSMAVAGLPISGGSPAFVPIRASRDATIVRLLRAAGANLLGKTNMPPAAIGGGQAGVYGRTRSPFNPAYLAAAWHSGSSIGSAVSVAAGYCDFGIGEETVSSGRSPASNNALVAYTPSWGVLSSAGNLPLHPYRDVVVPHATDTASLLRILQVIAAVDEDDVWHRQASLDMSPSARIVDALRDGAIDRSARRIRLGVPGIYVGEEIDGVAPIAIRPSIRALWERTEALLRAAGVELVRVPFPIVEAYEGRSGAPNLAESGHLAPGWTEFELGPLMTYAWTAFLHDYGDGTRLSEIPHAAIRPVEPWSTDIAGRDRCHEGRDSFDFRAIVAAEPPTTAEVHARAEVAVRGFDAARRALHDDWLDAHGLDGLVFPANGDIGPWDADHNPSAAAAAWRDGAVFSHGNHVFRRVGIPSVTIPMGVLDDIRMPVGLTLVGRGGDDVRLLALATELEQALPMRVRPDLPDAGAAPLDFHESVCAAEPHTIVAVSAEARYDPSRDSVRVAVETDHGHPVRVDVLGRSIDLQPGEQGRFEAERAEWRTAVPPLVVATGGAATGFAELSLEYPDHSVGGSAGPDDREGAS